MYELPTDKKAGEPRVLYQIIYADCPWPFRNYSDKWHETHDKSRWVGRHYSTMTIDEICGLPISGIADDNCCLFLWSTSPTLKYALRVIEAWGFTYKTKAFCWAKTNIKSGGFFTGMGFWTRANTEDCFLATKGHPTRVDKSVRQLLISPRLSHSEKPPEVRDRIVQLMGDLPRIELFARRKVAGWDCWGNEVESDIEL